MAPELLVLSRQITQSQTPVAIILVIGETDNSPGYRIDTNVFFFLPVMDSRVMHFPQEGLAEKAALFKRRVEG